MLITKGNYKKKYVIEGAAIFDSIGTFLQECCRKMRKKQ